MEYVLRFKGDLLIKRGGVVEFFPMMRVGVGDGHVRDGGGRIIDVL